MGIMLGNLTVPQLEERLGITLTDEERDLLASCRQVKAEGIQADKWHCFAIPLVMLCGSMDSATKVYEILKPYAGDMMEPLQITVES